MCAAIPLSPRQEAFCRFVARGHKLTTAASVAGYSPRSARQRGSEIWHKPEIQRRIAEPRAEREATRAAHIALSCQQLDLIFDSALRNKREGVALKTEAMRLMILDLVDAEGPTDTPGRLLPDSRANQDDDPIDTGAADANGSPPDLEPDPAPSPAPLPTTLGVLPPSPPPPAPLPPEGVARATPRPASCRAAPSPSSSRRQRSSSKTGSNGTDPTSTGSAIRQTSWRSTSSIPTSTSWARPRSSPGSGRRKALGTPCRATPAPRCGKTGRAPSTPTDSSSRNRYKP